MARLTSIVLLLVASFFVNSDALINGVSKVVENLASATQAPLIPNENPIAHLTSPQIIQYYGYPVETHSVTTMDGYILNMFRIPHGKNSTESTKGPVFIQHGLLCSSADWLVNTLDNNLPLLLADAGYDVWLGNARGTDYSQGHTNPSYNASERSNVYWNFSWHEMGIYDIPAVLDYITNVTNTPSIFYIGHSMGTTMFFVCMSEKPEYNSKIKAMYGLAPVAYDGNATTPVAALTVLAPEQAMLLQGVGQGQFIPENLLPLLRSLLPGFCATDPLNLCGNIFYLIAGYSPHQTNPNVTSAVLGHTPSPTSSRTFYHYIEEILPNKFRQFDFGIGNMAKYNSPTPPDYNLANITAEINLYRGMGDTLAAPKDILRTFTDLVNSKVNLTTVNYPSWNHLDFTYGIRLFELVLADVIEKMSYY